MHNQEFTKDGKAIPGHIYYCNFCGKSNQEVKKLVAGPTVFICDECVCLIVTDCFSSEAQNKLIYDLTKNQS